jgi:hypothetical protein
MFSRFQTMKDRDCYALNRRFKYIFPTDTAVDLHNRISVAAQFLAVTLIGAGITILFCERCVAEMLKTWLCNFIAFLKAFSPSATFLEDYRRRILSAAILSGVT